jgi:hypothetical protein
MKEARFRLKELLTDSPFPSGPYTAERGEQIQAAFKILRDQSTDVLFHVNDHAH